MVKVIDDTESLNDEESAPESLKKALRTFFVMSAVGNKLRLQENKKWSMLIHPSHLQKTHNVVENLITPLVNSWQRSANMIHDGSSEYSLENFFIPFEDEFNQIVSEVDDFNRIGGFGNIKDELLSSIKDSKIHIVNSTNQDPNEEIFNNNIFIGGERTGRGITFTNLIVTYLPRRAKGTQQADTVEQRARWFGYKEKYLDLCRVYLTSDVANDFMRIAEFEEDLWKSVQSALDDDIAFKDIGRLFLLPGDDILPTRRSVADFSRPRFGEWTRQSYINYDQKYADSNLNLVSQFIKEKCMTDYLPEFTGTRKIIRNVKLVDVYNSLVNGFVFPEKSALKGQFIKKLVDLLESQEIGDKCDIVFVNPVDDEGKITPRLRSIDLETGQINQVFQGHSPLLKDKPVSYPGDSELFDESNRNKIQLQVHYIASKNNPELLEPVFALHLPKEIRQSLAQLIQREE
jgi:hypothetical protein